MAPTDVWTSVLPPLSGHIIEVYTTSRSVGAASCFVGLRRSLASDDVIAVSGLAISGHIVFNTLNGLSQRDNQFMGQVSR